MAELNWLSAGAMAAGIREGRVTAEALAHACLARVAAREPVVGAWACLDADHLLAQARRIDELRHAGAPLGPLAGVPVGIKDVIDTADMATERGTALHAGRQPTADATVVARLRAAGALIMGKTVTTELATYAPGKTRNPHDPAHTPGGSSSGSAAAVADGMVPLALGTQTNGSVIRPAAFCGVFGFKPSRGLISRHGVLTTSRALDQMGFFARSVEDLALLGETLIGFDAPDPDTQMRAAPPLARICAEAPAVAPRLAFVRTSVWQQADADTGKGFAALAAALGGQVEERSLPESLAAAWDWQRTVMEADIAHNLDDEYRRGREVLSASLRAQIERGRATAAVDYLAALARMPAATQAVVDLMAGCDAILTPAVPGAAPKGLDSTGSPVFCTLWTYCGLPAVSLPLLKSASGLPIGVQLVGAPGDDARLLRTARWLVERVGTGQDQTKEKSK